MVVNGQLQGFPQAVIDCRLFQIAVGKRYARISQNRSGSLNRRLMFHELNFEPGIGPAIRISREDRAGLSRLIEDGDGEG
jgi:hypothetical protein